MGNTKEAEMAGKRLDWWVQKLMYERGLDHLRRYIEKPFCELVTLAEYGKFVTWFEERRNGPDLAPAFEILGMLFGRGAVYCLPVLVWRGSGPLMVFDVSHVSEDERAQRVGEYKLITHEVEAFMRVPMADETVDVWVNFDVGAPPYGVRGNAQLSVANRVVEFNESSKPQLLRSEREAFEGVASMLRIGLTYVIENAGAHPVEISPPPQPSGRSRKRQRMQRRWQREPWLREDLKTVIWIDFAQAKTRYGYRGGSHVSPRPHQRRGHWRTYRAEKWGVRRGTRQWVRPTWVGDPEWVHHGRHYKVITAEGATHD